MVDIQAGEVNEVVKLLTTRRTCCEKQRLAARVDASASWRPLAPSYRTANLRRRAAFFRTALELASNEVLCADTGLRLPNCFACRRHGADGSDVKGERVRLRASVCSHFQEDELVRRSLVTITVVPALGTVLPFHVPALLSSRSTNHQRLGK